MCKIYVSECAWHEGSENPIIDKSVFGTKDFSLTYFILKILPSVLQDLLHLSLGQHLTSLRKYRLTLTFKF